MNIITITGSPRMNGKTAQALNLLERELISQGHNIERISVSDYHITGCKGCFACHKVRDEPGCIIKDDASAIIDKLILADAVVYASPLYAYDITAQLKHWSIGIILFANGASRIRSPYSRENELPC